MKKPAFAKAYAKARAEIDSIDQLMRTIDEARAASKLSKAEVARRMSTSPVVVRRLLTKSSVNPSYQMVSKLAKAVGLRLVLEQVTAPAIRKAPARRREPGATSTR